MPEINLEFAKRLGIKEGGVDTLKKEIKKNMQRELAQALKTKTKQQVMDALFANNKLELPKAAIDTEIERLQKQAEKMYGQQAGLDTVNDKNRDFFTQEAQRRVALGLLIADIIKQNDLKVDAPRVRKMIEEIADAYEKPAEMIKNYYDNKQQLTNIEALVLEDQVVEKILAAAKITEKSVSFDEIIKPEQR